MTIISQNWWVTNGIWLKLNFSPSLNREFPVKKIWFSTRVKLFFYQISENWVAFLWINHLSFAPKAIQGDYFHKPHKFGPNFLSNFQTIYFPVELLSIRIALQKHTHPQLNGSSNFLHIEWIQTSTDRMNSFGFVDTFQISSISDLLDYT